MPLLASPTEVLLVRGVPVNSGSLATAREALELSSPILSAFLDTTFDYATVTDYFSTVGGSQCFRLSNGFVDGSTIKLRVATDSTWLKTNTDGDLLDSQYWVADPVRGVIFLTYTLIPAGIGLSVFYDYGFLCDKADINGDVLYCGTPSWLSKAAIAIANSIISTQQASPSGKREGRVNSLSSEMFGAAKIAIEPYRRPRAMVVYPTYSEPYV